MNSSSHTQQRQDRPHSLRAIAFLMGALFLAMFSLSTAAPIDESYQYDALNRLTAAGAATYQHDAAGNLVQMTAPATPSLFVTPSTRTVTYTANSSTTVSLTANVSWTASSNQTWLTVSPASGTTGTTLTLTATTQNPTTSTRSAIVTITGDSLTSQVTVIQDGAPPAGTLTITPTSVTVLSDASSVYGFGVTATGSWTSLSDQPWLNLTTSSGSGDGSVFFTITENTTDSTRTAHVTVTSGTESATFTLNQQASSVVDDHGGSIATATPIPTNASSATGVLTASDEDFFRVTVPGTGILIVWSEGDTDTYGHLHNSAGTQVDEDNDSDIGANFRVSAAVNAAHYYIRLRGNATETTGNYTLRTRFIPSTEPIQVTYLEKATNDVNLGFTGNAGVTYYLLGSDDLQDWTQVGTMVGTGAENYATLIGQGGMPKRFFRVSTYPPPPSGFALIPAESFQMGLEGIATPIHTVSVSAFYMAKYETTKQLWDEVRTWGLNNGYTDLPVGNGGYASKGAQHPVHSITWYDMVKWCNTRSEKEGLTPCYTVSGATYRSGMNDAVVCNWSANGYRLPAEAEWEKAARGKLSGKIFPWGDTISHSQANYNVYSNNGTTNYYSFDLTPRPVGVTNDYFHPSYTAGGIPYSSPVGSFAPNDYGLYDMAGNVWEWCWDWSDPYSADSQFDPRGAPSGTQRVGRGGGWNFFASHCSVADRSTSPPTNNLNYGIGFRIARSSVP